MRRGAVSTMVVIALAAAAVAFAVAFFIPWLPESASKEREGIDFVFWLTTIISVFIFGLVTAVLLYSVLKFRAHPDDESDGQPIHGHTGLEIVWTAIPTVLVVVIAVASTVVLVRNDRAGANPNRVEVLAQQFAWHFKYPNGAESGMLRVPLGRSTELTLRANDVIHSFWVPEFGQKQDAVPGIDTTLVITPTKLGTFNVICTELCGLGHSVMRSNVQVLTQEDYDAWLREAAAGGEGQDSETETGS